MNTFGPAFDDHIDGPAIKRQHEAIRDLMLSAPWLTLDEISGRTGYTTASISAQLRHLRKRQFGSYRMDKRRRQGCRVWEYRVLPPITKPVQMTLADAI